MEISNMSTSGRQTCVNNWLDKYFRARTIETRNEVIVDCRDAFKDAFTNRMQVNLRRAKPDGTGLTAADVAFEQTLNGIFAGPAPTRHLRLR